MYNLCDCYHYCYDHYYGQAEMTLKSTRHSIVVVVDNKKNIYAAILLDKKHFNVMHVNLLKQS